VSLCADILFEYFYRGEDMSELVHVIEHPLISHKLTIMRKADTSTHDFRDLLHEISMLMGYEVLRDLPVKEIEIETPLETMSSNVLDGKKLCIVSILRAGNGFLDGMLHLVPSARVGHIGLYRDPDTLVPVEYYLKLPEDMEQRPTVVVDPMLATGNSAIAALDRVKDFDPAHLKFMCLIAAPEGIKALHEAHPDVPIYTAAIDRQLNDHGYILPGIGDAGDRIYGTK
jgi:uracil phosphoribosyltransferase